MRCSIAPCSRAWVAAKSSSRTVPLAIIDAQGKDIETFRPSDGEAVALSRPPLSKTTARGITPSEASVGRRPGVRRIAG